MTERLADHLASLDLTLHTGDRAALRRERDRLVRLIRGVETRLDRPDAPLLVVTGGGSGAGKSTTVNTLARRAVSPPGVLRPTTRVPTLVCHPDDLGWFDDGRVLPDLVRVPEATDTTSDDSGRLLRLTTSADLPAGLALLDTPDIDSVELRNHELADEALDAADAWLWLTTARTYADEVGMEYLRRAQARQAVTAVALTQVRDAERIEVEPDLKRLVAAAGVEPDAVVVVPFAEVRRGLLPADAVAELQRWLADMAATPGRRREVRERALAGLQAALPRELAPLLEAAEGEVRAARGLQALVATRFDAVPRELDRELDAGLPLRGEIVDRWQQLVGGNQALLKVQTVAGRVGELVRSRLQMPSGEGTREIRVEVATELTRSISRLLEQAHREVRHGLEDRPAGRALLDARPALRDDPPEPTDRTRRVVAEWEQQVAVLVEEVGASGQVRARRLSTGLNAVATSAILVLFSLSGGLTGGEVGIAAGAAAANQWLLTKLLGEQNVRRLLVAVRADLFDRVEALAADERSPYEQAIEGAQPPAAAVETLREAVGSRR